MLKVNKVDHIAINTINIEESVSYYEKGTCEEGTVPEAMQGLRHIAFYVEDIRAWEKHLKEEHADFTMELTRMEPIRKDGILIRDPN